MGIRSVEVISMSTPEYTGPDKKRIRKNLGELKVRLRRAREEAVLAEADAEVKRQEVEDCQAGVLALERLLKQATA